MQMAQCKIRAGLVTGMGLMVMLLSISLGLVEKSIGRIRV